ncbi:hypothetical protein HaLaN_08431 [Haematococcus lacustris]|uniref:Uncharacterized protein n=1 Tax=Haematococcus lacustris TaxID=44745 RepID=A0A699YQV8_HAELA|nr:hypothetical protein HaLaN_08431 [Haematococcus lacustris]
MEGGPGARLTSITHLGPDYCTRLWLGRPQLTKNDRKPTPGSRTAPTRPATFLPSRIILHAVGRAQQSVKGGRAWWVLACRGLEPAWCSGCNTVEDTVEEGGCNPVIP